MNGSGGERRKDPVTEVLNDFFQLLIDGIEGAFRWIGRHHVESFWVFLGLLLIFGPFAATKGNPLVFVVGVFVVGWAIRRGFHKDSVATARIKRKWDTAIEHCGLRHAIPIYGIKKIDEGFEAHLRVGWGISIRDLQLQKDRIAASMGLGELMIEDERGDKSRGKAALLTILVRDDYLETAEKQRPPLPLPPEEYR